MSTQSDINSFYCTVVIYTEKYLTVVLGQDLVLHERGHNGTLEEGIVLGHLLGGNEENRKTSIFKIRDVSPTKVRFKNSQYYLMLLISENMFSYFPTFFLMGIDP